MDSPKEDSNGLKLPAADVDFILSLAERYYAKIALGATSIEETQARKRNATLQAFHFYFAALHFVHVSQFADDIAKAVNTSPQVIYEWAEEPEWEAALKHLGWQGSKQLETKKHDETVPVPLREAFLLKNVFQKGCDVRFVTYEGLRDARVKNVLTYDIVLQDGRTLPKLHVILAFPKDRMPDVKKGIKRRRPIAEIGLLPIKKIADRPKVRVFAPLGSLVECLMRDGLVVTGETIWVSRYNIVLRVGGQKGESGKVVLLYRHALLQFRLLTETNKPQKYDDIDFDAEADDGR